MDPREILEDHPLPLARVYRRCRNASEVHERHDIAYSLFEILLKYLSSIAISLYLAGKKRDHRVNSVLKGLARPSTGEWMRFLRECLAFVRDQEDQDPLASSLARTMTRKAREGGEVEGLSRQLHAFLATGNERKSGATLEGLLGLLITYRNRVLGHGAPLTPEHYRNFGDLFSRAFPEIVHDAPLLTSLRLVSFESHAVQEGRRVECTVVEYMGNAPLRRDSPLVLPYGNTLPRKHGLYLLGDGDQLLPVEPLLVCHEEDVYILNEAEGSPEYLSYSTGARHRPSDLAVLQAELFERILGKGYLVDSG